MVMPATSRKVVVAAASGVLAAPVALLSACSPPGQVSTNTPGTTPSVWTGASAPPSTSATGPMAVENLTTELKAPDGKAVATAKFEFDQGYITVTVQSAGPGLLSPGFHGMHIHQVGKCEPDSVAPTGGPPGNFLSAGGHYQAPGHTTEPASGDLTSLEVRSNGSALLVTTTDAITKQDLLSGAGTALIIHAVSDNFANIPADRYTQANGAPGADQTTMSTGDAGKRVACGVIGGG